MLLISEALSAPFDEGTKNVVFSLHREFEVKNDILSVTKAENSTDNLKVIKIGLNKLFLNNKLRLLLKTYSPDTILYMPENSCTFNSFLRAKILKLMCRKTEVIMLGVQHVEYSVIQNFLLKFLMPDLLLSIGRTDEDFFLRKGIKVKILPPAVDSVKFCPTTKEEKEKIRAEYNIPEGKTVVLHVGHIKASRCLECFLKVQKLKNIHVVIVGSASKGKDYNLKDRLVKEGIQVIDVFIPDISKIYKMSDVYVFPVLNNTAVIDVPLSVLEALACNLPIITKRFSGLVDYFKEDVGFRYFDNTEKLVELVKGINNVEINNNNSKKVEGFTWDRFAFEVLSACEELVLKRGDGLEKHLDYRDKHKGAGQAWNYEHKVYAEDSYYAYIWGIEKDIIINEIRLIEKTSIKYLDFACGTGRVISSIEQYVNNSTGVDVSENMLNIAKTKIKKSSLLHVDLTSDDIIKNEKYDLITAFRFFLNAQEDLRKEVMPLLSNKLSDDGLFIFNNHGNTFSYYILPAILGKLGMKQVKLNHLSYFSILKLIRNSNLKLKKVYGIGFIPGSFYRWFKLWRRFFMKIDKAFSNSRFLKFFAVDLIFICSKR